MNLIANRIAGGDFMKVTALGLSLALSAPALAKDAEQSGKSVQPQDQAQHGNSTSIEDIVVTARRSAERQQDVPIAITTISSQSLQDLAVRDIYEVTKFTPGLHFTSNQTASRVKITIRGQSEVDSRLTTDSSVGVYVDGVNWARVYGLRASMVDIAQIEVLRGPQGTLFGKNTTGGAIVITPEHPKYDFGGYMDLTYGSYNNVQALGVLNTPLVEDKLALRLVGQRITRDGFGEASDGQELSDDNTWNGRALLRADPSEGVRIFLSADYSRVDNSTPYLPITQDSMLSSDTLGFLSLLNIAAEMGLDLASPTALTTAYDAWKEYFDAYQGQSGYDGFQQGAEGLPIFKNQLTHYGFMGRFEFDISDNLTLNSITGYRQLRKFYYQDTDGTPFRIGFTYQKTRQKNFSQEFQLVSIDGEGLDWQAGLFYNRETGNEFTSNDVFPYINDERAVLEDTDVTNQSWAGYAQAVYNFSDAFRVTGGLRYTKDRREIVAHNRLDPAYALAPDLGFPAPHCNLLDPALGGPVFPNCNYKVSVSFKKLTWLLSTDFHPTPDALLYASISSGYRTGGLPYQGSESVLESVDELNAVYHPYKPETVLNYEVGFKTDLLDRRLRVNGAAFFTDYKDIQQRVQDVDADSGVILNLLRNAASAELYGGELEVVAAPVDGLVLNANVSYLHAEYKTFNALDAEGNILDLTDRPFTSPKWTYQLGAAYTVPFDSGSVRFNLNWAYIGTTVFQPDDNANAAALTQKGYGLLDGRLSWHIDAFDMDVAVFGKNLTDKRYQTSLNNFNVIGWINGTVGDPRTFGVQVRKTF